MAYKKTTTKKISGNMKPARQAIKNKIKKLGRKAHTVKSWTEWRKKQKEKFPLW